MSRDFDFDPRDLFDRRRLRDAKWVNPTRTNEKWTHPYSYSEFYIFGRPAKDDGADYSDRLWQWDYEKAERLWKEHVSCRWDRAASSQLSAFISAYYDKPLHVTALAEGCNIGNGYPPTGSSGIAPRLPSHALRRRRRNEPCR